jgi:hypothetical protein
MTTFAERMARVEDLVHSLQHAHEPARSAARELVAAVLELHREALARIVPRLDPAVVEDELVSSLLALHELHPAPMRSRVAKALERAPLLHADVVDVQDARIRVRVADPSTRRAVEELVWEAAPDATEVAIEDARGALMLPIAPPARGR